MDALGMVNALIGVVLVYFVLSLVVTALVEWWQQVLGIRSEVLQQAVASMYGEDSTSHGSPARSAWRLVKRFFCLLGLPCKGGGPSARGPLTTAFFTHPRIAALAETPQRPPSYVAESTFAEVLVEACLQSRAPAVRLTELRAAPVLLRRHLDSLPEATHGVVKRSLLTMFDDAGGDAERFLAAVRAWVEEVNDRATGWLRRRIMPAMFAFSFAVGVIANADTVRMFQQLTANPRIAEEIARQAAGNFGRDADFMQTVCAEALPAQPAGDARQAAQAQEGTQGEPGTASESVEFEDEDARRMHCEALRYAKRRAVDIAPLLGWEGDPLALAYTAKISAPAVAAGSDDDENGERAWTRVPDAVAAVVQDRVSQTASKLTGVLVTTFALTLGAPFWFQVLQKLVRVRASLRPDDGGDGAAGDKHNGDGNLPALPPGSPAAGGGPSGTAPGSASGFDPDKVKFHPLATRVELGNALWLSRIADAVYAGSREGALAKVGTTFEWVGGQLDTAKSDTQYLVLRHGDAVVVAFRGTEKNLADWHTNVQCQADPAWDGATGRAHHGFRLALDAVWSDLCALLEPHIQAGHALWFTGHSLGGALATLAAHRLMVQAAVRVAGLCTFGQPRCGDGALCADLDRLLPGRYWRAVHHRDPVPRVPTTQPLGYAHAGTLLYFDEFGRLLHDPAWWLRGLDVLTLPTDTGQLRTVLQAAVGDHGQYTVLLGKAAPGAS